MAAFGLKAQSPEQESIKAKNIYVSFDFVKHLVFPVQVSDIEVGEKELISAERVEEAPHVVRLCAQSEDFEKETNVTVVCIDGSVYTYHVKYIANGLVDPSPNIYEDNGKWEHNDYQADVSDMHMAEFFFPSDIIYGTQGNEMSFALQSYNNQLKVSTAKDAVENSNLFVIDKNMNTYSIVIRRNETSVFTYNYDDKREYTAHIDVNSEVMDKCLQELRTKKRNIYSVGEVKNKSYIDYDIEFVKCFQRDIKKSKNAIQQETTIDPIYTKDFETKIKGKSGNRLVLGFNKFTIPDNKIFEIELYEKGGGRHMKLAVENKYIIRAEPLFEK